MMTRGVLEVVVVLVCTTIMAGTTQSQYCKFSTQHVMCKHQGIGEACGLLQNRGVSAEEAQTIVAEHNRLRARVAGGREDHQPAAANMRQLEWDEELARLAQMHADQCVFRPDCGVCRRVDRFKVGQNLAAGYSVQPRKPSDWKWAIQCWYDEVRMFSPQSIQPFMPSASADHYTQMVWAETSRVGCGFSMHREGTWWVKLYTCNYGSAGNAAGGQMYSAGEPCSRCPAGTSCSSRYPGLCEDSESSSEAGGSGAPGASGQDTSGLVGPSSIWFGPGDSNSQAGHHYVSYNDFFYFGDQASPESKEHTGVFYLGKNDVPHPGSGAGFYIGNHDGAASNVHTDPSDFSH